jgi:hypothetical protein
MTAPDRLTTVPDHFLDRLVGRPLPSGQWAFGPHENWLLHDAVYSRPEEAAHPIMAFVVAQRGLGVTVPELFALLGTDMQDGPLLTESQLDLYGDLHSGTDYTVRAEVLSAVRKTGRTLGTFDLVCVRFDVLGPGSSDPVATVTNTYALPRSAVGDG